MAYVKLRQDDKGIDYYDVYYKVEGIKKERHAKFYVNQHGKYAKDMADYCFNNGIRLKNWFTEHEDENGKYIKLHNYQEETGKYYEILIDYEDFDLVKDYYWHIKKDSHEYYAYTSYNRNKTLYIHRQIMGVQDKPDIIVDHKQGNGLNNRRYNLRLTDKKGNNRNKVNMNKSNKTGMMGVNISKGQCKAFYTDTSGSKITRSFSEAKYGEEDALELAKNARLLMEQLDDNSKFDNAWKSRNIK